MATDPCERSPVSPVTVRTRVPDSELGGDPACWLSRVCENCGKFVDDEFARTCEHCGAARYDDDPATGGSSESHPPTAAQ